LITYIWITRLAKATVSRLKMLEEVPKSLSTLKSKIKNKPNKISQSNLKFRTHFKKVESKLEIFNQMKSGDVMSALFSIPDKTLHVQCVVLLVELHINIHNYSLDIVLDFKFLLYLSSSSFSWALVLSNELLGPHLPLVLLFQMFRSY
jgi:hypothetical protein